MKRSSPTKTKSEIAPLRNRQSQLSQYIRSGHEHNNTYRHSEMEERLSLTSHPTKKLRVQWYIIKLLNQPKTKV